MCITIAIFGYCKHRLREKDFQLMKSQTLCNVCDFKEGFWEDEMKLSRPSVNIK